MDPRSFASSTETTGPKWNVHLILYCVESGHKRSYFRFIFEHTQLLLYNNIVGPIDVKGMIVKPIISAYYKK